MGQSQLYLLSDRFQSTNSRYICRQRNAVGSTFPLLHPKMGSNATSINELRGIMAVMRDAVAVLEHNISHSEQPSQEQPSAKLRSSIYAVEAACAQLCSLVA
jgi:hypothetical protein